LIAEVGMSRRTWPSLGGMREQSAVEGTGERGRVSSLLIPLSLRCHSNAKKAVGQAKPVALVVGRA